MRKLIRPTLSGGRTEVKPRTPRKERPPTATHAEAAYLQQAVASGATLVVTLLDGKELRGRLEYFDRDCLKLEPMGAARILLRKDKVKYYRAEATEAEAAPES